MTTLLVAIVSVTGCGRGDTAERRLGTVAALTAAGGEAVAVGEGRSGLAGRAYDIPKLPAEKLALEGTAASLDDLLRIVERALAERDTTRLLDLMVSEREYREIVYPSLPAAHPPIDASFESIWVTHYPDAYAGLLRTLQRYEGRELEIRAVRFVAPDQDYVNFRLHETSRVDLTVDGRQEDDHRLFGSVIQVADRWKVLSYPAD